MNAKKIFAVAAAVVFTTFGVANTAKAQGMPNWGQGMSDIASMNANFDAQFDVYAHQVAYQVALATPNDQPLGIDAMSISRSISQGNDATLGYIRQSEYNSNRAADVAGNYSTYAVRGNAYYTPQYGGGTYELPYVNAPANGYYLENGYVQSGYAEGGNNFYVQPYQGGW